MRYLPPRSGARRSEIDDPPPPHIVDGAERPGRCLEHHRPLGQFDDTHEIDGVRVGRQEQRLGIHQVGEHEDFVVLHPYAEKAVADGGWAHGLEGVHEHAKRVREVEIVVNLVHVRRTRRTVPELERADARLDLVGRRDLRRNTSGRLGVRGLSRAGDSAGTIAGRSRRGKTTMGQGP